MSDLSDAAGLFPADNRDKQSAEGRSAAGAFPPVAALVEVFERRADRYQENVARYGTPDPRVDAWKWAAEDLRTAIENAATGGNEGGITGREESRE